MNRKGGLPAVHMRSETAIASHGGWWPPLHLERMVRPLKWRPMIDATDAEPGVRAGDARMDQENKGSSYDFFGSTMAASYELAVPVAMLRSFCGGFGIVSTTWFMTRQLS